MDQVYEISDLTSDLLTTCLCTSGFVIKNVVSFTSTPMEDGVLSRVYRVDITYVSGNDNSSVCNVAIIAKLRRVELPLKSMFEVESAFYKNEKLMGAIPFSIPTPIYLSDNCILLECITDPRVIRRIKNNVGCNEITCDEVLKRLAEMHSVTHKSLSTEELSVLASPAGIGAALPATVKQEQFSNQWSNFVKKSIPNDDFDNKTLKSICKELCESDLVEIHKEAESFKIQTLIHGDFHVSNMLFGENIIWLLDWATCGLGNPLRDVVFFMMTSLRTEDYPSRLGVLRTYYNYLSSTISANLSWEDCVESYVACVLNQFVILVCYDSLSQSLVASEENEEKKLKLKTHFETVNYRLSCALLEIKDDLKKQLVAKPTSTCEKNDGDIIMPK